MARKERVSRGRSMRPNYFVFCEGETEVAYTEMLRAHYRLPIHVILMYDLDVPEMLDRLRTIQGAELLCSNPCFELWLLLHYSSVGAALTSRACLKRLEAKDPGYRKGVLSKEMLAGLREHVGDAIERAKALPAYLNPSTTVYLLVEDLDQLVKV